MARHIKQVRWSPSRTHPPDESQWPYTVPVVRQLIAEGAVQVPDGVTFLIGENGSGKSTLVEALAAIYPRTGHATKMMNVTGPVGAPEDSPLRWNLRLDTAPGASPAGFFLRAELMHTYLRDYPDRTGELSDLNARSHGESFLAVLRERFADIGVYFMDEPEAALSFTSSLGLVALLGDMVREGSQVVVATHSPLLVALPGATIWEIGEWGRREVTYDDCELVGLWRAMLDSPERFTRHL
ncbi:AAA family ATPase [soil metagenome]